MTTSGSLLNPWHSESKNTNVLLEMETSAKVEHTWQEQYRINSPETTILDSNHYRVILESWHIHQQKPQATITIPYVQGLSEPIK